MKPYTTPDDIRAKFNSARQNPGYYFKIDYHLHPRSRASHLQLIRNLLFQNDTVIHVKITQTNLSEGAIIQLMADLEHCPELQSIGFIDIHLSRAIIDALLTLLRNHQNIVSLEMWRNEITTENLQYLLKF